MPRRSCGGERKKEKVRRRAVLGTPYRMPTFVTLAMVSIADADVNPERTGLDANRTMKPMFNVPSVNTAREMACPTKELPRCWPLT